MVQSIKPRVFYKNIDVSLTARFFFPAGIVRGRQLRAGDHSTPVQTNIAGRFDRSRLETANRGKLGRPAARKQQDARAT